MNVGEYNAFICRYCSPDADYLNHAAIQARLTEIHKDVESYTAKEVDACGLANSLYHKLVFLHGRFGRKDELFAVSQDFFKIFRN